MNKEDILTWLTQLGTGWVGLNKVYEVFKDKDDGHLSFWEWVMEAHDATHIGKRLNTYNFERGARLQGVSIEQYRLNKRAIDSLEA